jgi:hypothetical protein
VHDAELMQVGNSTDDMLEKSAGLNLLEFCLFDDVVKKFSFFYVLHNKEEVPGGLDDLNS